VPFDREGTLRKAEKLVRQGKLDQAIAEYRSVIEDQPADWNTANSLGDLYARSGKLQQAVAEYSRIAEHLATEGFVPKAIALYRKILKLKPDDEPSMLQLGQMLGQQELFVEARSLLAGVVERRQERGDTRGAAEATAALEQLDGAEQGNGAAARPNATKTAELKETADQLFLQGREDEAVAALRRAADGDPRDIDARLRVVRILIGKGDHASARNMLTPEAIAADLELKWLLAELNLREGRLEEGSALMQQILERDPKRRNQLVRVGCTMADSNPKAAFECVDLAARAAISQDDWTSAAACFSAFATRTRNNVPALMRLVEICVDGGLEAAMVSAQVQLADAYLALGAGAEARVIAEDLVAREPWEHTNIERFRQALELLGEDDADAIIAERLAGQSPFVSTDVSRPPKETRGEAAGPRPAREPAPPEVDLSEVIHGLQRPTAGGTAAAQSIEQVLKSIRDEIAGEPSTPESAEQHFKLATACLDAGSTDEAMQALEVASRSLRHRFRAAVLLAKLHTDRHNPSQAVEWLERAADAPAPSREASHELLYQLAAALEAQGESARALAVYLELQAEAGDYRDLAARLEHLTKVC